MDCPPPPPLQTGLGTFIPVEMYIIPVIAFILGLVLQVGSEGGGGMLGGICDKSVESGPIVDVAELRCEPLHG